MTDHMEFWNKVRQPPTSALKKIKGGRLSGMTDISPQWRYQAMTEHFGPCGVGWAYEIEKMWSEEGADGQKFAFASIKLYTHNGVEWSKPVAGIGGSMLVTKESKGLHSSDEGYKMAVTDALSVAMKMLGMAADIYLGKFDGSKYNGDKTESEFINTKQQFIIMNLIEDTDSDNEQFWKFAKADTVDTILASEYGRVYSALRAKADKAHREPGSDDE